MIRQVRPSEIQTARLGSSDTISVGTTVNNNPFSPTTPTTTSHTPSLPSSPTPGGGDETMISNSSSTHYATLVNAPSLMLNSINESDSSSSSSSPSGSDSATPVPTSASTTRPLSATTSATGAPTVNATVTPPITSTASQQQQLQSSSSTPSPETSKYPFSIRLSPFVDHSSSMPAFYTGAVEREARDGSTIKIGRYDNKKDHVEGDDSPHVSPIVFKSKVVSRSHAEFICQDGGQWFVKDVKSSSGTFLNHIRLSIANEVSRPFALKDGDVLQLGVDFRGGVEEVFKCIKVRVELNRSWQKKPNNFNINQLSNLRNLFVNPTLSDDTNGRHENTQECAICLLPVSACQSLFIAPCSHSWHYKCIRPVIVKAYPHFLCPNCRAICDLEADVEVPDLSHLDQPTTTTNTETSE